MDTSHSGLLGRAQQVASWSLRRLLGRPQRDPYEINAQQQQQQQQPGQNAGAAANFTPNWRGIRQGWPAGVTCAHLEESWFAADVVEERGAYCYCGCSETMVVEEGEGEDDDDDDEHDDEEERQRHREEVARDTLAEMLQDAVPFARSDGTASRRADPRIVRATRARLLWAFVEDVAGEGGDAFGIREKKKKKDKKGRKQQKRTKGDNGEGAAQQQEEKQQQQQQQKRKQKQKQRQPRTFPRFPDLPAELRLEIWSLALRGRSRGLGVGVVRAWRYNWHADVLLPALAAVCREARDVVLAAAVTSGAAGGATGLTIHDRLDLGNSPDGRKLAGLLGCVGKLHGGVVLGLNHFLGRGQAIQDDGLLGLDLARLAAGGGASLGKVLKEVVSGGNGVVLVTVQTVYITLGSGTAPWEGSGGGVEGYLQRLQAIGEFDFVKEVDVSAGEGFGVDDDGKVDAGMYWRQMIPHEACHHVTEVVPLGDAARMRRILAVGEVTGQWEGGRRPKLLAVAHHSHAFCLDRCLREWWDKCGEETVRAGMERVIRADGVGVVSGEEEEVVVLPEVVPAVRFKIQWPGLEPPMIADGEVCWET
ncbi:hypothetical protein PspLS_10013 [Pyricularia sp. CBS 133598]|nr:hypothetical protein PspLS_10013 [Pyricularia sp. CBS 133598]